MAYKRNYCRYARNAIVNSLASGRKKKDIAKLLGMTTKGLYEWIRSDPELKRQIAEAEISGKNDVAMEAIEHALFLSATGYVADETKVFFDSDTKKFYEKTVQKHWPPNQQSARFLLTNMDPAKWSDKQVHEIQTEDTTVTSLKEAAEIFKNDPALLAEPIPDDFDFEEEGDDSGTDHRDD